VVKIRRGYVWTKRRIINWTLLVVWVIAVVVAFNIPPDFYGQHVFSTGVGENARSYNVQIGSYPFVTFKANFTFQTIGVFSAVNAVHFSAVIYNAPANLTKSYCCIAFTNATISNPNDERLIAQGSGVYTASGTILFLYAGNTWLYLNPHAPNGVQYLTPNEFAIAQRSDPVLMIGSPSDTLTVEFDDAAVWVAVIFGTFSILLLQPIIEGIVIGQKDDL
jgi:hypothetical protein